MNLRAVPSGKTWPCLACKLPVSRWKSVCLLCRPKVKKESHQRAALAWYSRNRELASRIARERRRTMRHEIIQRLGGKCVCCGESHEMFLAIDHKNGGGTKHRRSIPATTYYRHLYNGSLNIDQFQIMCHNCNSASGYYGACPHSVEAILCA